MPKWFIFFRLMTEFNQSFAMLRITSIRTFSITLVTGGHAFRNDRQRLTYSIALHFRYIWTWSDHAYLLIDADATISGTSEAA
jgi:hypothetical protein